MKNAGRELESTSLLYLETVAKLRYAFSIVANLLYIQQQTENSEVELEVQCDRKKLLLALNEAKKCCCESSLNNEKFQVGPALYLLKLLARKYGLSFIIKLECDRTLSWIVPSHLFVNEDVSMLVIPV